MSTLQDLFNEAAADAKARMEAKLDKKTTKQLLMAELVKLSTATLAIGDIILGEHPLSDGAVQSFSDADLAYAGGYLGGLSAIVSRLSTFVRDYPTE